MRFQILTQLDPDKHPQDEEILQACARLKSQRKYTQTFRDAIRLILSLRVGDTSVLYELFPELLQTPPNKAQLDAYFKPFVKQLMSDEFLGADQD